MRVVAPSWFVGSDVLVGGLIERDGASVLKPLAGPLGVTGGDGVLPCLHQRTRLEADFRAAARLTPG